LWGSYLLVGKTKSKRKSLREGVLANEGRGLSDYLPALKKRPFYWKIIDWGKKGD